MGTIPEARHTYAYLNTAYPALNEKQLAIGETTFGGPDTLVNPKGLFTIEELERVALQRCTTAREAIKLMGELAQKYGYGDSGECLTLADPKEVWQFEILGCGKDEIGAVWAARRIPDDHVGVSANIPRIGSINRKDKNYCMASDNVEAVARKYGLWDGKGEFVFWRAYNCDYAKGRNFHDREFFSVIEHLSDYERHIVVHDLRHIILAYHPVYPLIEFDLSDLSNPFADDRYTVRIVLIILFPV